MISKRKQVALIFALIPLLLGVSSEPVAAQGRSGKGRAWNTGGGQQRTHVRPSAPSVQSRPSAPRVQRQSYSRPSAPRVQRQRISQPVQRAYRAPQVRRETPSNNHRSYQRPSRVKTDWTNQTRNNNHQEYRQNKQQRHTRSQTDWNSQRQSQDRQRRQYQNKSQGVANQNSWKNQDRKRGSRTQSGTYRPTPPATVTYPVTYTHPNQTRYVNQNVVVSRPHVYRQPHVYSQPSCPPVYTTYYNPVVYSNYSVRRYYRPRVNCVVPLLSLGFYLLRPYNTYDYARVGYDRPYFYGDDTAYQPPVEVTEEGGPVADASSSSTITSPASIAPSAESREQSLIGTVSGYVESRSTDGRFQLSDAAFNGETWSLELAQAPAVFEIADGVYSVVAGFEGTLGASPVPSNVVVEFFVGPADGGYEVKSAWITSANGIPRTKLYQSPIYPDIQTWQPGLDCPFTGQPMVEIKPAKQG